MDAVINSIGSASCAAADCAAAASAAVGVERTAIVTSLHLLPNVSLLLLLLLQMSCVLAVVTPRWASCLSTSSPRTSSGTLRR
jgi:hypothetical protein